MQGRLFGDGGWNPRNILLRIALQQAAFYAAYASCLALLALTVGTSLHPDYIWSPKRVSVLTSFGWAGIVSWIAADVSSCWALPYTAQRAKRCWDYSATVLILHTVLSWVYDAFPLHWDWWVIAAVSFVITTTLGEWLCMRVEMADISVDTILQRRVEPNQHSGQARPQPASASAPTLGQEQVHSPNTYKAAPSVSNSDASARDRYPSQDAAADFESSPLLRGRSSDAGGGSQGDLASAIQSQDAASAQQPPRTPARVTTVSGTGVPSSPTESGAAHSAAASPQSKAASLARLFSTAPATNNNVGAPGSGSSRQRSGKLA